MSFRSGLCAKARDLILLTIEYANSWNLLNMTNSSAALCIPYTIRVTAEKGRGLFADANVRKDTTVWRHVPGEFAVFNEHTLKAYFSGMSRSEIVYELEHVHCMPEFPEYIIKAFDDGELINHSDQPTLRTQTSASYDQSRIASTVEEVTAVLEEGHFTLVAARDIKAGEELTIDYNADPDDPDYFSELSDRYGVSWDWL